MFETKIKEHVCSAILILTESERFYHAYVIPSRRTLLIIVSQVKSLQMPITEVLRL